MITGQDIRRYRQIIGMDQIEFARRMGRSQPTLSQLEAGTTPVSEHHIAILLDKFGKQSLKMTFADFMKDVQSQAAKSQAALFTPGSQYTALTIWKHGKEFDLNRIPSPDQAVGMVMIRATDIPVIALQMGSASEYYLQNETLVFEKTKRDNLEDNELVLAQIAPSKARTPSTILGLTHGATKPRSRDLQIQPISPTGPIFTVDDEKLLAVLRLIHRSRYVH